MRKIPLNELNDEEFEKLIVLICDRILGMGTINFSKGPDGGQDGRFTGKAQNYPSQASPWEGRFIIQAKHTEKINASCSDASFKQILKKEVQERLKNIIDKEKIDYYLLFTNRKLSGNADVKISDFIKTNLTVKNRIIGEERIQLWLQDYPKISKTMDLNRFFLPLDFYEKDLKEIILKFSKLKEGLDQIIKNVHKDLKYIDKTEKNRLNKLSEDYFKIIRDDSLSYFSKIDIFLKDPANREYKNYYLNTVADLRAKITIHRDDFHLFEELFGFLYNYIVNNNLPALKETRRLVWVFLHYMYWNCDIGLKD